MPFIIPAILGGSVIGGALSGRPKTTTGTSTSNYSNTSTSTPNITPEQHSLFNALYAKIMGRLNQPTPLGGYEATGLSNINAGAAASRTALENRLAAHGLSGSPVAGNAETQLELGRAGEATRFQNSLPLLARQFGREDEASAAGLT